MKVFVPMNIEKGWFASKMSVWPFRISLIQLFIVAFGAAIWLVLWNKINQATGEKILSFILAFPVFIIFLIIAFFQISELGLIPFIAKLIQTYFFDVPKRFYTNYDKIKDYEILIYKNKMKEQKKIIQEKDFEITKERIEKLKKFSF